MTAKIKILDCIHCRADPESRKLILKFLKYKRRFYKKKFFGGKNIETTCHLITGRDGTSGLFYTGLLPMIKKEISKNNLAIKIIGKIEKIKPLNKIPTLKGIEWRKEQLKTIKKFTLKQRGRIVLPTGYGKTLVAIGIISLFADLRILFLCHTTDLLKQNSTELDRFDFDHLLLDGKNKIDWQYLQSQDKIILLSTIQSLSRIPTKNWNTYFDLVIVDEQHHATKENSQYGKLLRNILAPMRLGLTATLPTTEYEKLVNEGLFGPIIAEVTNQDGISSGILAKPIITLLPVPLQFKISEKCRTYQDYQRFGIVENTERNKLIISEVLASISLNETVLIIVENLKHGQILSSMLSAKNITAPFVQGSMERDERISIKENLKCNKNKVVICSKVWREGIDIPSVNKIVYSAGMKEEKLVKQALGRGQRTIEGKIDVKLVDFLDPYPYLASHAIQRICIYKKEGWI